MRDGLADLWRDKWWRMYDRDPITTWVSGSIALLGDAAHPPLRYLAQGAIMAIEDGWLLAEHAARNRGAGGAVDWAAALDAYQAVRPEHCRRVVTTSRAWDRLWHLDGPARLRRNALLGARGTDDYACVDRLYGPTALFPGEEPEMFRPIPLDPAAPPQGAAPKPPSVGGRRARGGQAACWAARVRAMSMIMSSWPPTRWRRPHSMRMARTSTP
ncbi:salicylate hydroxylase [Actinacidiphila yanglinensis]|uniref:Salicylate hydroxylase n=1 Tax=Actinacidiphila yanglinensis TaxID=310779 RepID=A0A1H6AVY0_9ACTN|nr:salicylate hydroxylase [Actinacidiphila yanglinensis]